MNHRLKLLIVVVLTFVITLSAGFLTEYIRQSITYSWAIDVGDEFVYDVSVTGNRTLGSQTLPPSIEPMNNTRVIVEITSLPNLTLMYYSYVFIQEVVEHTKTALWFDDRSPIPSEFNLAINPHCSRSLFPRGAWRHLDSLFPDQVDYAIPDHDAFIARMGFDSFFFGYWSNRTDHGSEWYGIINLETGVPIVLSFSEWDERQPWNYFYTVTMTIDN